MNIVNVHHGEFVSMKRCLGKDWDPGAVPSVNCLFNHPGWHRIMKTEMCLFPLHTKGKPLCPLVTTLLYLVFAPMRCLALSKGKGGLVVPVRNHTVKIRSLCICSVK